MNYQRDFTIGVKETQDFSRTLVLEVRWKSVVVFGLLGALCCWAYLMWLDLGEILASPGFCTERLHMYLARGLTHREQHLDKDEFLDVVTVPFRQLVDQVMDGTITDAKTVATTLKVKVLLGL